MGDQAEFGAIVASEALFGGGETEFFPRLRKFGKTDHHNNVVSVQTSPICSTS